MKHYLAVGFTTTALASGFVALAAIANAAPTGPSQVDDTVRSLEAEGYNVIVNRTGAALAMAARATKPDAKAVVVNPTAR